MACVLLNSQLDIRTTYDIMIPKEHVNKERIRRRVSVCARGEENPIGGG